MKPYIICHMMQSIDGRIACDMVDKISGDEYYDALEQLGCPSHIEGKHSYQIHYTGFDEFRCDSPTPVGAEEVFVACRADGYSICPDTRGTLLWDKCDNSNRLCILSERASRQYLDYLRSLGISYIVTGKESIDLPRAIEILNEQFGVERLAVVGGGKINGAFLAAGLIDELSAMIAPGIDGRDEQPALFDGIDNRPGFLPQNLHFKSASSYPNGVIWLRYDIC